MPRIFYVRWKIAINRQNVTKLSIPEGYFYRKQEGQTYQYILIQYFKKNIY